VAIIFTDYNKRLLRFFSEQQFDIIYVASLFQIAHVTYVHVSCIAKVEADKKLHVLPLLNIFIVKEIDLIKAVDFVHVI
jgi:hypothetical protein